MSKRKSSRRPADWIAQGKYSLTHIADGTIPGCPTGAVAVFKGRVILGIIAPHPCGERVFLVNEQTPPLRGESLLVIWRAMRQVADAKEAKRG